MRSILIRMLNVGAGESIYVHIKEDDKSFGILIDGGHLYNSSNSKGILLNSKQTLLDIGREMPIHAIVISHVDEDHIGGIINLLKDWKENRILKNFYLIFNDYIDHQIAFSHAETLINIINELQKEFGIEVKLINTYSKRYIRAGNWGNKSLHSLPVEFMSIFQRRLIKEKNRSRIYITLLSPGKKEINSLMSAWKKVKMNGSSKREGYGEIKNIASICLLLEYNGKAIVFSGDSSISLIKEKIEQLNIKKIDCFNLCHHGAYKNNVGIIELLNKYKCNKVFLSTNSIEYPEHPNLFLIYKLLKDIHDIEIYMTNPLRYDHENFEKIFVKDLSPKSVKLSKSIKSDFAQKKAFFQEIAKRIGEITIDDTSKTAPIHFTNLVRLMDKIIEDMNYDSAKEFSSQNDIMLLKYYIEYEIRNYLEAEEQQPNSRLKTTDEPYIDILQ